jgi:FADH2 O2-dependent halogenase
VNSRIGRAPAAAGEQWALLPSAAAFVDPLFSTGIPLTLLGIERLARVLERGAAGVGTDRRGGSSDPHDGQRGYGDATLAEADYTARFIAGSYAGFRRFEVFAAYSMFYFAAASFSEMARRLSSPLVPRAFLCGDSAAFVSALRRLSPATVDAEVGADGYDRDSAAAVGPWNIAGLCDRAKHNWYGVDPDDTVRAATKLGLTPEQVRSGLAPTPSPFSPPSAPV